MDGSFRRRNLPHVDVPGGTYFITFCLAGSLPSAGYAAIACRWRERAQQSPPAGISVTSWRHECASAAFLEVDSLLDGASAARWLADPRLSGIVESCLRYWDGVRYRVVAHVIMPSHCHVVIDTSENGGGQRGGSSRESIMHSIKRHSAQECNRLLSRRGAFWQPESYDRVVRDPDELERIVSYVEWNPVKAGLCERPEMWRFSSAFRPRGDDGTG